MYSIGDIGCSTNGYKTAGLERALRGISEAGFKAVEIAAIPNHCEHISANGFTPAEIDNALKLLDRYGLKAVSLSGHMDLTGENAPALMNNRLNLARELGVRYVNTGTGEAENEDQRKLFFANIAKIAEAAQKEGIYVALETHGGLTGSAKECLATLERVCNPYIQINYDTANVIYYRGVKPEDDIELVTGQIAHVHLKDILGGKGTYNFPPIGDGNIDFKKVFASLCRNGYKGPMNLEIELQQGATPEEEDAALIKSYAYLHGILS